MVTIQHRTTSLLDEDDHNEPKDEFSPDKELTMRQPLKRKNGLVEIFCMSMRLQCFEERMKRQLALLVPSMRTRKSRSSNNMFWMARMKIHIQALTLDDNDDGTVTADIVSSRASNQPLIFASYAQSNKQKQRYSDSV
eukprot:scaffold1850_cov50-Cyclotella_meneghiniana.AAC.2